MKIDIEDNIIFLISAEDLKKYQISQLNYYGYMESNNNWIMTSHNLEIDLLKIIDYLNEENIIYELSEKSKCILRNTLQKKRN